jgi:hypothetical protein
MEKPGPTGRFPDGKLCQNDKGEIAIAVGINKGQVFLYFGTAVQWVTFPPEIAQKLGVLITENATKLLETDKEAN